MNFNNSHFFLTGYSAARYQGSPNRGDLSDPGHVHGARYQVSYSRTANRSERGV